MSSPFDLRRFAPPAETTFTLSRGGDHVYAVPGDPEVDDVVAMLRIENVVRGIDEGDPVEAFAEGKALLIRLIQECQPETETIKIGPQELIVIFALIVKGPTVAEAVMESITATDAADRDGEASGKDEGREPGEGEQADVTPLPSAKRSSAASSNSDDETAGLRATGTA